MAKRRMWKQYRLKAEKQIANKSRIKTTTWQPFQMLDPKSTSVFWSMFFSDFTHLTCWTWWLTCGLATIFFIRENEIHWAKIWGRKSHRTSNLFRRKISFFRAVGGCFSLSNPKKWQFKQGIARLQPLKTNECPLPTIILDRPLRRLRALHRLHMRLGKWHQRDAGDWTIDYWDCPPVGTVTVFGKFINLGAQIIINL